MLKSHPAILMTNETGVCLQLHNLILKAAQGRIAGTPFGKEYCELWSSQLNVAAPQVIRDYYHRIATLEQRQNVIYWGDKHPHQRYLLAKYTKVVSPRKIHLCCAKPT